MATPQPLAKDVLARLREDVKANRFRHAGRDDDNAIDWPQLIPVVIPHDTEPYEDELYLNALGQMCVCVSYGRSFKAHIVEQWRLDEGDRFRQMKGWDVIMNHACVPAYVPISTRHVSYWEDGDPVARKGLCDARLYLSPTLEWYARACLGLRTLTRADARLSRKFIVVRSFAPRFRIELASTDWTQ